MYIVDAARPGDNVSIKIRGLGTINDSNPLVVIDGVPTDLGLASINTADIERIDVLKDASATAIYGSRGANGVVMVTTKKGSTGKGKVSVTANWAMQNVGYVPEMLNAAEYAAYSNDMLSAAGLSTNPQWSNPASLGEGTDWLDEMFQTGFLQNYTVSYSGGNEKAHYYVSGGFLDQSGTIKTVGYRRFTFQNNNDAQVLKWLKFTNNITFSTDVKSNGSYSISDAMNALPTQPVKNDDGSWSGPEGNSYWYGDVRNPVGTLYTNDNKILFGSENEIFQTSLISGYYPDVKRIIPKDFVGKLEINKKELIDAIERTEFNLHENTNVIYLCMDENKVMIKTDETELGSTEEELDKCDYEGESMEIKLNGKFLKEALNSCLSEKAIMEFAGSQKALRINSGFDVEDNYTAIMVPLREVKR